MQTKNRKIMSKKRTRFAVIKTNIFTTKIERSTLHKNMSNISTYTFQNGFSYFYKKNPSDDGKGKK
tara:strand:- start:91 stop:288 length:198 start_codon:yes stop_codon:yes gene_type:complete